MPDTMHRVGLVQRNRTLKLCYIFSSNDNCNLDVVGKLLSCIKEKLGIKILTFKNYFSLSDTTEMCEGIIPDLPMDFAIFVVHANEDRFLINEDSARIYRALLNATGGKVLVVIGGDDNYKDSAEEQGSFLSRWARRKVSSQFSEEYLDGRQSFMLSWDDGHRPIHEEALLHYFNPDKKEKKFVPEKKTEVAVTRVVPKQEVECGERREISVKRSGTEAEENFSNKIRTGVQRNVQHSPQTENAEASLKEEEDEHMDEAKEPFEDFKKIAHADIPEEVPFLKAEPKRARFEGMDTSPPQESIAILIRNESDINTIKEVFGDVGLGINPVTSRDPASMKDFLLLQTTPVRSCFIIVESNKLKEELLTKSSSTAVYKELLKTANGIVEKKILVIICSEGKSLAPDEEESITATIMGLLGKKGLVFWCRENNKTKRPIVGRSHSLPDSNLAPSTYVERPINPKEFTLVFKTRLRLGKISYDEKDVKVRAEGWTAPPKMVENLLGKWHTINNVELSVYRENKTGNDRTVVTEDLESRVSGLGESFKGVLGRVGLPSWFGERVAKGTNTIGAGVTSFTEVGTDVINVGANVLDAVTQFGSNLMSGSGPGTEATGSIANEDGPSDGKSNISDIPPD